MVPDHAIAGGGQRPQAVSSADQAAAMKSAFSCSVLVPSVIRISRWKAVPGRGIDFIAADRPVPGEAVSMATAVTSPFFSQEGDGEGRSGIQPTGGQPLQEVGG